MNVHTPTQSDTGSSRTGDAAALFPREMLLDLLVAIRGSKLDPEDKTTVRDLVLEYAKLDDEAHQRELHTQILDILEKHPEDFSAVLGTGTTKVTPPTAAPASSVKPADPAAKAPLKRARRTPVFRATRQNQTSSPAPTPAPESVPTPPADTQPVTAEVQETPEQPVPHTPPPAPESAPVVAPTPSYSGVHTDTHSDPMVRIKEIKHHINEQVGNPVNLVDVDNEVGREYMSALLDAMKKASGGVGGIDTAMERLEKAYAKAVDVLAAHESQPATPSSGTPKPSEAVSHTTEQSVASTETAVPQPAPTPEPQPEPVVTTEAAKEEVRKVPIRAEHHTAPTPEPAPQKPAPEPQPQPKPAPQVPRTDAHSLRALAEEVKLSREKTEKGRSRENMAAAADTSPVNRTEPSPQPTPEPAPQKPTPEPQQAPQEQEQSVQPAASTATTANTARSTVRSLDAEEVTAGLEQLLSEWSLFRKSGFLGSGPSGSAHPLYQKLAGLPMASVVSGRFEGATAEVKQNISDYMNGWRYEQNIVPDMQETFEHYLRRVIQHILNESKQRAKNDEAAAGRQTK